MLKKLRQSNQGFTIIEVLIVLAIAALILLIIFFAVPALQRNNRNTQLRNDAAVIIGFVNDYAAATNGKDPEFVCATTGGSVVMGDGAAPASCVAGASHKTMGNIRANIPVTSSTSVTPPPAATDTQKLYVNLDRGCAPNEDGASALAGNDRINATAVNRSVAVAFLTERQGGVDWQCTEG
jgi:prepilin-type N-terminal cleavage/methylation domain-containing protein